ncbi:MAG: LON peptidase substrate-binding domain-containing protein, partial [Dehalococcoidia bacterium]
MDRLRLFPLRTVLFPGMALSLQVFEERYRVLVAECLEADEPFGVVLIREGPEVGGAA